MNQKWKANKIKEKRIFLGEVFGIITDVKSGILWNVHSMIKKVQDSNYQKR